MTYLTLLFVLAAAGLSATAVGESMVRQQQRERERELIFRGQQIRAALVSYRAATPTGQPPLPTQLEELVEDTRHMPPVHHLRRLYADPFTGAPDWVLLRRADGRITGVHSRSTRPPLGRGAHLAQSGMNTSQGLTASVGNWHFAVEPGTAAVD